jgi:hypothetical protein
LTAIPRLLTGYLPSSKTLSSAEEKTLPLRVKKRVLARILFDKYQIDRKMTVFFHLPE